MRLFKTDDSERNQNKMIESKVLIRWTNHGYSIDGSKCLSSIANVLGRDGDGSMLCVVLCELLTSGPEHGFRRLAKVWYKNVGVVPENKHS